MHEDDLTYLEIAKTPFEARIIHGILQEAGIPAYIDGASLADEVAMSRMLMNAAGVRIQVRQEDREAALQAIEAAKLQAQESTPEATDADPQPPAVPVQSKSWSRSQYLNLLLVFLVLTLGTVCLKMRSTIEGSLRSGGMIWDIDGPNEWARWADSGSMAVHRLDGDRDGFAEQIKIYNLKGQLVQISHDPNSNGIAERIEGLLPDGRRVIEWLDEDEDGVIDQRIVYHRDQTRGLWTDTDGDGVLERRELQDAQGKRLLVEIDRPGRGFERQ